MSKINGIKFNRIIDFSVKNTGSETNTVNCNHSSRYN